VENEEGKDHSWGGMFYKGAVSIARRYDSDCWKKRTAALTRNGLGNVEKKIGTICKSDWGHQ